MTAISHVHKIVDDATPTPHTVHFDATEGTSPTEDQKIIPKSPVFIERRKAGAEQIDRIWDGNEQDEIAFTVRFDHDLCKNEVNRLKIWYENSYNGTYELTYYSDEYPTGITVEIIGLDYVKPTDTDRSTYLISITLVKII